MGEPKQRNLSDESQVKASADKQRHAENKLNDHVSFLMANEDGQRFLWWLLGECGVGRLNYSHSGSQMYFMSGEQNVGQKVIEAMTAASPKNWPNLQIIAHEKGFNNV